MRFTVVTPVLNGMPWLPQCVESVAEQQAAVQVEHFVMDAGSSDGSREWLMEHRSLGYEAIFEADLGQTDALIKGFERASGQILSWLNADDMLEPGSLARVARAFTDYPEAALVSGCCSLIDADGSIVGMIPAPPVATYQGLVGHPANPAQPATFFRADAYRRAGGLDPRLDLAMDVDLWLRLARTGPVVFLRSDTLARFRLHPASKSVTGATRAIRQDFAIRRRNGLRIRSEAGLWFVRRGYVAPWLDPVKRQAARAVKSVLVG